MPSGDYDKDAPIHTADVLEAERKLHMRTVKGLELQVSQLTSQVERRDRTISFLEQEKEQLLRIITALLPQSVLNHIAGCHYGAGIDDRQD